jgi:hypothetical protein
MAANPTVTIFNANPLAVQMTVNNGPQFAIAGATAAWVPQSPTTGAPTWSNVAPGQNVFSPGPNSVNITPTGALKPYVTTVNLPDDIQWDSLQLYIYFNGYKEVSWVVLNGGQFVTANVQLSSAAVRATADA